MGGPQLGRLPAVIGRSVITDVSPVVSCGRWPAKAVGNELIPISATVFREGHDLVGANVGVVGPDGRKGPFSRLEFVGEGTDRYEATISLPGEGTWAFFIEAWADPIATWHHAVEVKAAAGQDVVELGVVLVVGAWLLVCVLSGFVS